MRRRTPRSPVSRAEAVDLTEASDEASEAAVVSTLETIRGASFDGIAPPSLPARESGERIVGLVRQPRLHAAHAATV